MTDRKEILKFQSSTDKFRDTLLIKAECHDIAITCNLTPEEAKGLALDEATQKLVMVWNRSQAILIAEAIQRHYRGKGFGKRSS